MNSDTALDISFFIGSALALDGIVNLTPRSNSADTLSALSKPLSMTILPSHPRSLISSAIVFNTDTSAMLPGSMRNMRGIPSPSVTMAMLVCLRSSPSRLCPHWAQPSMSECVDIDVRSRE